jgi:hypothetical protein
MNTKESLKIFKYNTIFILIIYSIILFSEILLKKNIFLTDNWIYNLFGLITAFFFYFVMIEKYIKNRVIYLRNFIKYLLYFIFQNLMLKIYVENYLIFSHENLKRIILYLFLFVILDIFLDLMIDDNNKYANLYSNSLRILIAFVLVESMIKGYMTERDYIYIFIFTLGYYIFYLYLDPIVKAKLKN